MSAQLPPPPPLAPSLPNPSHIQSHAVQRFRVSDILMLGLGSTLFLGSLGIFASGMSLRTWLLGWPDESKSEPIGTLTNLSGQVERKRSSQPDFEAIANGKRIFNHDTLVTAENGKTTLRLDDGSEIELSPSTMVRLEFDQQLAFGGVKRNTVLEIVSGSVKGRGTDSTRSKLVVRSGTQTVAMTAQAVIAPIQAAPTPTPKVVSELDHLDPPKAKEIPPPARIETQLAEQEAPLQTEEVAAAPITPQETVAAVEAAPQAIEETAPVAVATATAPLASKIQLAWVSPATKGQMRLTAAQFGQLGQEGIFRVPLQWTSEGSPEHFKVKVLRDGQPLAESRKVSAVDGQTEYTQDVRLSRPGTYTFEITPNRSGEDLASSMIRSEIEFVAEVPTASAWPTATDRSVASLPAQGSGLEWPQIKGAKHYSVEIFSDEKAKALLLKKDVEEQAFAVPTEISEKHEKVYYRVTASLGSGFSAVSPIRAQSLLLSGPVLTLPKNGSTLASEELNKSDGKIVLTWQRVAKDKTYKIEVSRETNFKNIVLSQSQVENFAVVKLAEKGRYFWRVSAERGGRATVASAVSEFTLDP